MAPKRLCSFTKKFKINSLLLKQINLKIQKMLHLNQIRLLIILRH